MKTLQDLISHTLKKDAESNPVLESEGMESMSEVLDMFMTLENIYHFEGRAGVNNFSKICKALGYDSVDDFLEDNPGALNAIVEWISGQEVEDWKEKLLSITKDNEEIDIDDVLEKITKGTGISARAAKAIFLGGSSADMADALDELENEYGYDSAGAWEENKEFFKGLDISRVEYQALVDASQ